MTTFLNLEFGKEVSKKLILKHILFSLTWISFIALFIFRLDLYLVNISNNSQNWSTKAVPLFYLLLVFLIVTRQKWYYNLALIFYPFIFLLWFFPKYILERGKFYLFIIYVNFLLEFFRRFRKNIFYVFIFSISILLLILTKNNYVKIFSILSIGYFYSLLLINYTKKSFAPPSLFGLTIENKIKKYISDAQNNKSFFIDSIEKSKEFDTLEEEERKLKKIERLILLNSIIENFSDDFNNFYGKRAFTIFWVFQFIAYLLITELFFTFLNYQIYSIDHGNFTVDNPSVFDFLYYTIKSLTFEGLDSFKPASPLAKSIEIIAYLIFGIFFLVFALSFFFIFRQDKLNQNLSITNDFFRSQNQALENYISTKYQKNISQIIRETKSIQDSIETLRKEMHDFFF